jgi:hypothetical protein
MHARCSGQEVALAVTLHSINGAFLFVPKIGFFSRK